MDTLTGFRVVAILALVGCLPADTIIETTTPPAEGVAATVTRVVDGDSIEAEWRGRETRIRIDGINAPDLGECYFEQATQKLISLLDSGSVMVISNGTDQFGRVLAELRSDGVQINLELVATGHAIATTPLTTEMSLAEAGARSAGLGLWARDTCGAGEIPPIVIDSQGSEFNPPGPDEVNLDQERVVLFNPGPRQEDIGGWTLRDESSLHRYRFPAGTTLAPGGSITITSANPLWEPGDSPVWNNDGDIVILMDMAGRVVAAHRY